MTYPYIHTGSSISIRVDGKQHVIQKTHVNFSRISDAIKAKDWDAIPKLVDIPKMINTASHGKVEVKGQKVFYNGEVVHNALTQRIIALLTEGFDIDPFVKFMENLMLNPSKTAIEELYLFLEACSLPITDDGYFLAYKKVRTNYMDFYTGKFRHHIGDVLEMDRAKVDDNRHRTCSDGFHFCSFSYLPHYASNSEYKVMVVKIHPKDVVAIPSDYNNAKGRACRYTIVDEHEGGIKEEGLQSACYKYDTEEPEVAPEPVIGHPKASWPFPVPTAPKAGPARDSKGRFIRKAQLKAAVGPQRDSKGRFVKRS